MFLTFFLGIFVGIIICIPVGPINICVINIGLKKGFKQAMAIALGASTMDFLYFFLITSGLSFFSFSENTSFILKVLGIMFIFGLAIRELFFQNPQMNAEEIIQKKKTYGKHAYFFLGILLYISNPTFFATLTAIASFLKSSHFYIDTHSSRVAISLGISIGTSLWFLFLIKLIHRYSHKFSEKFLVNLNKICAVLLIALCTIMTLKLRKGNL